MSIDVQNDSIAALRVAQPWMPICPEASGEVSPSDSALLCGAYVPSAAAVPVLEGFLKVLRLYTTTGLDL